MSNALKDNCRLHSALLLTIFCTWTIPVGSPAAENSAMATSGAGPLGDAVGSGDAECKDHAAMAAAAMPPLNRKARRVTFCRGIVVQARVKHIGSPKCWTHGEVRSYKPVPWGRLSVAQDVLVCVRTSWIRRFSAPKTPNRLDYVRSRLPCGTQEVLFAASYASSCLVTNSFSSAGLACPLDNRITWPTKNAATVFLPARYCSSCLGLAAMIS